jgi:hypothetical protein
MSALKDHYSEAIEAAISKAKTCRDLVTVEAFDGTEAYAYPHREGRIAWGINTEKEGIKSPEGHQATGWRRRSRKLICGLAQPQASAPSKASTVRGRR